MAMKRNTREQILNEAFKLSSRPRNSMFSLSEVAEKVGISKTAIFRHFKNKEELLSEMKNVFLTDIAGLLSDKEYFFSSEKLEPCGYEQFHELCAKVLNFFFEKPVYLGFFLNLKNFENGIGSCLMQGLEEHGVVFSEEFKTRVITLRFVKLYFCLATMIFYFTRRMFIEKDSVSETKEEFIERIIKLTWNGIGRGEIPFDKKRLEELNAICDVSEIAKIEDTRFFKAFAKVFAENGINGVTIERLSDELNLAKSSLYSYFNNKAEFINKMLYQELNTIREVLVDKLKSVKSFDEMIYVIIKTESNYLLERPFVVMMHCWASESHNTSCDVDGKKNIIDFSLPVSFKDPIHESISENVFIGWVSALIGEMATFVDMKDRKLLSQEKDYAFDIFKLIECGVHK
ncbi:MAG: TetR/AcrR family transcriptional regulator [Treponema sp.]|nr:TetR/AcrR family transcriptional regulator [Candidatus Treponema scatequi]